MSRGAMPHWKVVLIVEDDSDGRALRSLAHASGLPALIDWLPAHGIGNIKRRADALIRLATDRIEQGQGCVAVVVDRDGKDHKREEPHRTIQQNCAAQGTAYVEAVEALESWLLADNGISSWLGVASRSETDRIRDPKSVVARAFHRKAKRTYQKRRARVQLAAKATGVRSSLSPSWAQALAHLENCPIKAGS